MKSNTITINLNYNENELQLDIKELINSIKFLLSNKYKENNIAYEVIDTSVINISIPSPSYPINPCPIAPSYPYNDKPGDTPEWWKRQPTCTITPNTTPINSLVNNK